VSNLGRVETTHGGRTHRAIFVVRSRATLKSRKYLFGKSVRISDFLRHDFRAWLFIWRKSAYVGYWRATLRTSPSSGQAAINALLCQTKLIACHSRATFEGPASKISKMEADTTEPIILTENPDSLNGGGGGQQNLAIVYIYNNSHIGS